MQVLEAAVPSTAEDFIKNELFQKLGVSDFRWETGVSGLPTAGYGSSVTSRDMVKLGNLVMNGGQWQAEQLIPEKFVQKSSHRIFQTDDDDFFGGGKSVSNAGYGYYWWQADLEVADKRYATRSAQGGGGQFIILVDDLDLIIVTTAHEGDVRTMQLVAERILPAFL